MSSNMETLCAIGGAGKISDYFKFDWKKQLWNLKVVAGAMIGGYVAANYLTLDATITLNPKTIAVLSEMGFQDAGQQYLPPSLFHMKLCLKQKMWYYFFRRSVGGFWCTIWRRLYFGHAITGLSNLQLPSFIAVFGFYWRSIDESSYSSSFILAI